MISFVFNNMADFGQDYSVDMLEVTFPETSVDGDTACGDIGIIDDTALEGDHNFTVAIADATNLLVVGGEAVVTLLDNDGK